MFVDASVLQAAMTSTPRENLPPLQLNWVIIISKCQTAFFWGIMAGTVHSGRHVIDISLSCLWKPLVLFPNMSRWHLFTSYLSHCELSFSIAGLNARLLLLLTGGPVADGADVANPPFSFSACDSSRLAPFWKVHIMLDKWKSSRIKVTSVTLLVSPYGVFLALTLCLH